MMRIETPGEFPETGFVEQLDWLEFSLSDISRSTPLDAGQYYQEQIRATQESMAEYAGKVIAGGTRGNRYFVAEAPGSQLHLEGSLPYRSNGTNDFVGILQDMQDITVRVRSYSRFVDEDWIIGKVLCLEIEPIGDQPPERLPNEYEARRHQPFAVQQNTGMPIWVPVRWLETSTIESPELTPLPYQR